MEEECQRKIITILLKWLPQILLKSSTPYLAVKGFSYDSLVHTSCNRFKPFWLRSLTMLELTCAAVQFFYLRYLVKWTLSNYFRMWKTDRTFSYNSSIICISKSYVHILMFIESLYITFQNVFSAFKLLEYLYESFS